MTQKIFHDHELYVLEHWADARLLEGSIKRMREAYAKRLNEVLDRVAARHKELDRRRNNVTETPSDDDGGLINVGIGRKAWSSVEPRTWPSGLWIGGVSLDDLKSEAGEAPYAAVWINPSDVMRVDLVAAAARMDDAAKNISTQVKFTTDVDHAEGSACVSYYLPESRQDLLSLLLNDASGFHETMVAHFEVLAKFINVVDDIFRNGKRNRK